MNSHRNIVARTAVILVAAVLASCAEQAATTGVTDSAGDGWRSTFGVDVTRLTSSGDAHLYPLRPGTQWVYEEDDATLTITVLDQTELVDGVTTRVVEEREEKCGRLVEVSRNFFALDRTNGDLYYFGEDVDIYKNGTIANHEGAWRSGVNGARFGLLIPGNPVVGDRYYQEVAPGVAMDRAEVVSIDEQVTTPAGVFEHCLHIKETTPLEKGTSHKWFAPGVGLIKDDDLPLTSHQPAAKK